MSKFTDTDKLDFLECYVRHNLNLHAVCAEYGLKYNTAAMRLKTIQDGCAKRRGNAGDSGASEDTGKGGKAKAKTGGGGGKKKAAAGASTGAGKEKAGGGTKGAKKRKLEVLEDGEEEKDKAMVKKEKGVKKEMGVKGEQEEDDAFYDFEA